MKYEMAPSRGKLTSNFASSFCDSVSLSVMVTMAAVVVMVEGSGQGTGHPAQTTMPMALPPSNSLLDWHQKAINQLKRKENPTAWATTKRFKTYGYFGCYIWKNVKLRQRIHIISAINNLKWKNFYCVWNLVLYADKYIIYIKISISYNFYYHMIHIIHIIKLIFLYHIIQK